MTFHDLKLPKEFSKKKKLDLYKCWILTPLEKGSDLRVLEIHEDFERMALTEKAAVILAINQLGSDEIIAHANNLLEYFNGKYFIIIKITLTAGSMDEEVIIPPENKNGIDTDPHYDPIMGVLNVTVKGRISDCHITNYALTDISLEMDDNTHILTINNVELKELVINKSVTGGK